MTRPETAGHGGVLLEVGLDGRGGDDLADVSQHLGDQVELPIVDTVERLQGMTVELIVLSATASDPDYISSIGGFLFSVNRLNVAVSRARSKAIVMGAEGLWAAVPASLTGLDGQCVWKRLRDMALGGMKTEHQGDKI